MTAKNQSNVRLAAYVLSLLVAVGVSLYAHGGKAAMLESRLSAAETWISNHVCEEQRHNVKAAGMDKQLAVITSKLETLSGCIDDFKTTVRDDFVEVKESIKRLHDARVTSHPTLTAGSE